MYCARGDGPRGIIYHPDGPNISSLGMAWGLRFASCVLRFAFWSSICCGVSFFMRYFCSSICCGMLVEQCERPSSSPLPPSTSTLRPPFFSLTSPHKIYLWSQSMSLTGHDKTLPFWAVSLLRLSPYTTQDKTTRPFKSTGHAKTGHDRTRQDSAGLDRRGQE